MANNYLFDVTVQHVANQRLRQYTILLYHVTSTFLLIIPKLPEGPGCLPRGLTDGSEGASANAGFVDFSDYLQEANDSQGMMVERPRVRIDNL